MQKIIKAIKYALIIILLIMIIAYLMALMIFCFVLPPRFQHITFELIVKVFYDLFVISVYSIMLLMYASITSVALSIPPLLVLISKS